VASSESHSLSVRLRAAQASPSVDETIRLAMSEHLPWETLASEHLAAPKVWRALVPAISLGALVRNLGRMTANSALAPFDQSVDVVCQRFANIDQIRRARLHPIQILAAAFVISAVADWPLCVRSSGEHVGQNGATLGDVDLRGVRYETRLKCETRCHSLSSWHLEVSELGTGSVSTGLPGANQMAKRLARTGWNTVDMGLLADHTKFEVVQSMVNRTEGLYLAQLALDPTRTPDDKHGASIGMATFCMRISSLPASFMTIRSCVGLPLPVQL
jgi:TROVE domain